jgi:hypothetical protein
LRLPPKSNAIIDLEKAVAILEVRADTANSALEDTKKLRDEIKDMRDRLIKLEAKLEHLEKQRSEEHGRTWAIKLVVVSALIGSGFTILTQFLSRYLPGR